MKTKVALFSLCALTLMAPPMTRQAEARQNSLSGGGSISYEINRQNYDDAQAAGQANNDNNYSRVIINPVLTIQSLAEKNAIGLTYAPSLIYGDGNNGDIYQTARINANWSPTSRWNLVVADSYQETDTDLNNINRAGFTTEPPTTTPGGQQGSGTAGGSQPSQSANNSQLTNQPGRQKYTNNTFNVNATYQYWEDSFFKLGYELDQLRYDDLLGSNQNSDRHIVSTNIKHRLNSQYSLTAAASYARGTFDQAEPAVAGGTPDVDEFHFSTSLQSLTIPHHPLSLTYFLDISNYDDSRQPDTQIHTLLLGWTWEMSEKSNFSLSAGPTYQKSDTSNTWSYALNAGYNRQWSATGHINFNVAHGMEMRNFSGNSNDNGQTEYWRAGVGITQALSENLSLNLMATAADEDIANGISSSHNTTQYTMGGGLSYSFGRWYSLGLNYSYTTQNGDLPADSYDEQRLMLVLSMQRDFLHW